MKKIRINELARELEVKAHEILDRLPELGVSEKKTHSSSIDEDVAIKLRRLYGFDTPETELHAEPAELESEAEPGLAVAEAEKAKPAASEAAPVVETRPAPRLVESVIPSPGAGTAPEKSMA